MSRLAVLNPPRGPALVALLAWQASQAMLTAVRIGDRPAAIAAGLWLSNARNDPRCSPALRRLIDSAMSQALAAQGEPDPFEDGEQP